MVLPPIRFASTRSARAFLGPLMILRQEPRSRSIYSGSSARLHGHGLTLGAGWSGGGVHRHETRWPTPGSVVRRRQQPGVGLALRGVHALEERHLRLLEPGRLDVGVEAAAARVTGRNVVPLPAFFVERQKTPGFPA